MKNTVTYDNEHDWEHIVNEPNRQKRIAAEQNRKAIRQQDKLFLGAFGFGVLGMALALLGTVGWLVSWVAYPAAVLCCMQTTYFLGRFVENGKCRGWRR